MSDEPGRPGAAVGARVRVVRRLRGLTQEQLARRTHLSVSLVKKVETGSKAASPYFVATVARALRVSVPELYGQPTPRFGSERVGVAELETAVMAGFVIAAEGLPHPLADLEARTRDLMTVRMGARYERLAAELPPLLADLHTAVSHSERDERRRAYRLLAEAHLHAARCLHVLGSDLAAHATEAGERASERGDDPVLAAVIRLQGCGALLRRGAFDAVRSIAHEYRCSVEENCHDSVRTRSALGFAHLRSVIAVARTGDLRDADRHLRSARRLADRVPADANAHATLFNQDNVTLHGVAAAVEAGEGEEALARVAPVGNGITRERRAHHHIDLARAHLMLGHRDDTLSELNTARSVAPQLTRYHPQVHESVRVLAASDRRRSDSLAGFARWAGVAV